MVGVPSGVPDNERYYSLDAFKDRENISLVLRPSYDMLSLVDRLNESQAVFHYARVPGGVLLFSGFYCSFVIGHVKGTS
jgi:hypothetical protein